MRTLALLILAACGAPAAVPIASAGPVATMTPPPPPTPPPAATCAVAHPSKSESWGDDVLTRLPASVPYGPRVEVGNQQALNTSAVPFAQFLNSIHNRIHPIFADGFIGSLETRPKTDPLNDNSLITRIEVVIDGSGAIETMGVVKASGQPVFDAAGLEALRCAGPFEAPPAAILSPDGKVYLHWEFHRDEVFACSTMHARPFLLAR